MKLLIYRGDTLERTLELAARDFRIGRAAENDIVLEDPEKTVSRFHAELRYEHDAYALIDLNSQNGTWIDGERVRRTALGPGQSAVMGNFRIEIDGGGAAVAGVTPQSDTLSGEMPQTIAMSSAEVSAGRAAEAAGASAGAGGAGAAAGAGSNAAGAASAASGVRGGASTGAPPAAAGAAPGSDAGQLYAPSAAAHGVRHAALPNDRRAGSASIPRPMLYGGALVFLLLIVGVMYVMRPQPGPPADQGAPQAETGGPESNEQIIARFVSDGRAKLEAGDAAGAIAAASRALVVDPNQADALDLKMKAEERRRQDEAKAAETAAAAQTAAGTTTPAGTAASTTASGAAAQGAAQPAGAKGTPAGTATTGKPIASASAGTPSTGAASTGAAGASTATAKPPAGTTASNASTGATGAATGSSASTAKPPASTTAGAATGTRAQRRVAAERDKDIAKRYATAKAAMSAGNYTEAAAAFEAIVKERPGYMDAASMLDQSRGHIRTQAQQVTQQAAELAAKGDFAAALQQYERARRLDPSLAGVEQGVAAVRRQMKEAGDDAFRRARQLDAVGRAQAALPLYERAAQLLSADDANGKTARERLDALKTRTP